MLLRLAGGDAEAEHVAERVVGRSGHVLRDAAGFFIEQILLHPEAGSYRVLGTTPDATAAELRRNMAWLMAWLHPDRAPKTERTVLVSRITRAWNDLKTPDRRAAYDESLRRSVTRAGTIPRARRRNSGLHGRGRVLSFLLGRRPL
jgi:DnaJ-class molecular chaperone